MKKNGRLVCINGTDVRITGMDYDYLGDKRNSAPSKFNITFDVFVHEQFFTITFTNERLSAQGHFLADTFIGTGEAYNQFLQQVESNPQLKEINQYSDETNQVADTVIGEIAQSVYIHEQSHSPDQDEE